MSWRLMHVLRLIFGRSVKCSGGCGRRWRVRDRHGEVTASIECAACYYRRWGHPVEGFVGFKNGALRTTARR